jgi:hypothetical protein
LKEFCKIYKWNKKTEKEKKKRKKNMKLGLGEPFGPARRNSPWPANPTRNGTAPFLFLSLTRGPHCQVLPPPAEFLAGDVTSQ